VFRSVARFRLRVHTLRYESATWNSEISPSCDLCQDIQDEHVLFHCSHFQVSFLRRKYACLFMQLPTRDVSFLHQSNNKVPFFLHELMCFYEQASSHASWLKAFFLCNPVTL